MKRFFFLAALGLAAIAACDRERVEVAEPSAIDGAAEAEDDAALGSQAPSFPVTDAQARADAECTDNPPPIGSCRGCRNGFLVVDGKATCECCGD